MSNKKIKKPDETQAWLSSGLSLLSYFLSLLFNLTA